jgi:uncharacterized protein with von Willebrand factor type A (vWA) domain
LGDVVTGFAAVLRAQGVTVPLDTLLTYARALDAVGLGDRDRVYWAGRASLVRRPEDVAAYDEAFREYWDRRGRLVDLPASTPGATRLTDGDDDDTVDGDDRNGDDGDETEADAVLRWSRAEVLRHKDLAAVTDDERAETDRLIDELRWSTPTRRSRRLGPSRRGVLDLRRTVAAALRADGEPVVLAHRAHGARHRRVVLLIDVSGSMAPYARALLRFAHVAVRSQEHVEVFTLGTRLTRITAALRTHDADAALRAATDAVPDYEGGTRLGDTVAEFTDQFGVRGMARQAVLVVLSDGWDRGDPAVLAESLSRLARVAHRIVWVNPLKASAGYEPLARGMAAALPFVDDFLEGHAVASLDALAGVLAGSPGDRPAERPAG